MELKGVLGFKGERGYSAYEVAVNEGFQGTVKDWLATLGTSQRATITTTIYKTTENQKELTLPSEYMPNVSAIEIYVDGLKISSDRYTIDYENKKINLLDPISTAGKKVEVSTFTFSSNSLPIVETINENSTNDTTAGTKAVYDFIKSHKDVQDEINNSFTEEITGIKEKIIFDTAVIEVEEE